MADTLLVESLIVALLVATFAGFGLWLKTLSTSVALKAAAVNRETERAISALGRRNRATGS